MTLDELKEEVKAYRKGHMGLHYDEYIKLVNSGKIINFSYADLAMWKELEDYLAQMEGAISNDPT